MRFCFATSCFAAAISLYTAKVIPPTKSLAIASEKTPGLHLTVQIPASWEQEWYRTREPSVVRVYDPATDGADAVVVAAVKLPPNLSNQPADVVLDEKFFRELKSALHAKGAKRVHDGTWDGAVFEYPLPSEAGGKLLNVAVKNWMRIADGYLVQFQTYYYTAPAWSSDTARQKHESLAKVYDRILRSVQDD